MSADVMYANLKLTHADAQTLKVAVKVEGPDLRGYTFRIFVALKDVTSGAYGELSLPCQPKTKTRPTT